MNRCLFQGVPPHLDAQIDSEVSPPSPWLQQPHREEKDAQSPECRRLDEPVRQAKEGALRSCQNLVDLSKEMIGRSGRRRRAPRIDETNEGHLLAFVLKTSRRLPCHEPAG